MIASCFIVFSLKDTVDFTQCCHLTSDTHIKNLKSSNVQHTNEVLARLLGIQRLVDSHHHPQEHFLIH